MNTNKCFSGYSQLADLKMFQKTMPTISLSSQMLQSYLDLQSFWQKLEKMSTFKFPYEGSIFNPILSHSIQSIINNFHFAIAEKSGDDTGKSLSNLVHRCMGKPLDKSNQFSNWENRPLRNEQIAYAALDAYCLMEIYDIIQSQCKRYHIDFNEHVQSFLVDHNKKKLVSKKTVAAVAAPPVPINLVTDGKSVQSPPRKQYYPKQPNHQALQCEKQQPQQH